MVQVQGCKQRRWSVQAVKRGSEAAAGVESGLEWLKHKKWEEQSQESAWGRQVAVPVGS